MANIRFYRKKQDGLIMLSYHPSKNHRIRLSTGQKCQENQWNKKSQRAKGSSKFDGNAKLNALLDKIRDAIAGLDAETRRVKERPPTAEEVKSAVYQATGREREPERGVAILDFFRAMVEGKRKSLVPARVRQYTVLLGHLDQFGEHFYPVSWGNLNARFAADFEAYSFEVKGHAQNTFMKHINLLKVLMGDAVQATHITQSDYETFRGLWRGQAEYIPTHTYLTIPELNAIRSLKLEPGSILARVQSRAIAQAFTGVRQSDLEQVREKNISTGRDHQAGVDLELISIVQDKTKMLIKIPLHPYVREVLDRNSGRVPPMALPVYNRGLKELCRKAGIDMPTPEVKNRKGKVVVERKPKWQHITSHKLRASAVTHLIATGVPESTIMTVIGWKERETMLRYVRLVPESQAGIVARSEYFRAGAG